MHHSCDSSYKYMSQSKFVMEYFDPGCACVIISLNNILMNFNIMDGEDLQN